jgi:catechol 2,3-dioxygenase
MSYPRVQAYEHAQLAVDDLGAAVEFCTGPFGLVEIGRQRDAVYLGCGYDDNYDLSLVTGGTGVRHFALRLPSSEHLDELGERSRAAGLEIARSSDAEPGEVDAVSVTLPDGHTLEFVVVADQRYLEPYRPARRVNAHGPIDNDHISVLTRDVRRSANFLVETFGFRLSDLTEPVDGGDWFAAWTRMSPGHHDVGFNVATVPGQTLHHVAFAYSGIDHMKVALDALSAAGHRLELGPGRHPVGANLYAYVWTPGGNRFELCAEGAILDPATPTRVWRSIDETLDVWGTPAVPATFGVGS